MEQWICPLWIEPLGLRWFSCARAANMGKNCFAVLLKLIVTKCVYFEKKTEILLKNYYKGSALLTAINP